MALKKQYPGNPFVTNRKSGKVALFAKMLIFSDLLRRVGIDVRRVLFKKVIEALGPNLRLAVDVAIDQPDANGDFQICAKIVP